MKPKKRHKSEESRITSLLKLSGLDKETKSELSHLLLDLKKAERTYQKVMGEASQYSKTLQDSALQAAAVIYDTKIDSVVTLVNKLVEETEEIPNSYIIPISL